MVNSVSPVLVNALFGQSTGADTGFGIGAGLLTAWASAKAGIGVDLSDAGQDPNAPLAPVWRPGLTPADVVLLDRAVSGKSFFDLNSKLYSDLGATGDYKRLFALHSGLTTLGALAGAAGADKVSATRKAQLEAQFARGLTELEQFFAQQQFEDVRLAQGDRVDQVQTTLALPSKSEDYVTAIIHRGSLGATVSGVDPNAKFDIVATSLGGTERRVSIDLSEMNSLPRSLSNIVTHVNGKLAAAGAASRIEAVDQTPKTTSVVIAGRTVTQKYTGLKQYALKVGVVAGERVAFEPVAATPAFYAVGSVASGARLIKLADVGGAAGLPALLSRPGATVDPIGDHVAAGWSADANAFEQRTNALLSPGVNNFEDKIRAAGEAALKLSFADGRSLTVTTAWRAGDQETWRMRDGESEDYGIAADLAERLTQLLHEQGVAASVEVWSDRDDNIGLSIKSGDLVSASTLIISGKAATLEPIDPPGMVGGLRDGVFARRFEAGAVAGASELFVGDQRFVITTSTTSHAITIAGGEDGIDASTLETRLNEELRKRGIAAAASLVDEGGALTLRLDGLHSVTAVTATLNETDHTLDLQTPGAWSTGGLPNALAGQPFADAVRSYTLAGSPLSTYTGALDIEIDVATPGGIKTVTVSVSALERSNDPDSAPGEWSAAFHARLDQALNAAGAYVSADGADLASWRVAEGAGQRIAAIRINGDNQAITAEAPAGGLGGAHSVARSFTSANAATGVGDEIAALVGDPNVSITFSTPWGARTISAALEPGDPRTLESAALRLNEALAAAGYDLGVAAVGLSGGGAGLRIVSGASHTVRGVSEVSIGGGAHAVTLDPVDAQTHGANPVDTLRAHARATRGAAVSETSAGGSGFVAPSGNSSAWFPGRAFDVAIGGGAKVATARAVAAGADGSVYVLADLNGDSDNTPIKGARDVALLKYDSAGKLLASHLLGASTSASGFALAVSADGKVAVAGSVEGDLAGAGLARGGADAFVTLFGADGTELWTGRRGASANDEVRALAFASDGSIIVAGKTDSVLGSALALGGADAYVSGFSATGTELFNRQFGTGRDDAATALLVRDDGAGGFDIFTGGVEDSRGVVRRFGYSSASGFAEGAVRDIGYFHSGAVNALAYDNGALLVGGEIGADRLALGAPVRAAVAGQEGFVARLDADLVSTTLDRATYIGSAQDDAVRALAVVDGVVYAAGQSGGVIVATGGANAKAGFFVRLNADGDVAWMRNFNSASGSISLHGLAVDTAGASPLDVLGLPRGVVGANDSSALVNRSALRAGDEFSIGIDGRRLSTIRITASDTLQSLLTQINRAIGASGRATLVRENGAERIQIVASDGKAVRIEAGRQGRDALAALGLGPGIIARNSGARGALKTFGLGIVRGDLKLATSADIAKTKAEISAAISIVRQAYETLLNPNAKEPTEAEKKLEARRQAVGAAPQYYTQQLANYQIALARLTGGG